MNILFPQPKKSWKKVDDKVPFMNEDYNLASTRFNLLTLPSLSLSLSLSSFVAQSTKVL